MMDNDATRLDLDQTRNLKQQLVVDQVCRRFQDEWNSGRQPAIEETLSTCNEASTDDEVRRLLLEELIILDVALRKKQGESPQLDDYVSRFSSSKIDVAAAFHSGADQAQPVAAKDTSPLPKVIGDYRVIREIGRGGMGVVYEAEQVSLRRTVALKTLLKQGSTDPDQRLRFDREARAIAKLHHTNIVDVFGNGEHEGVPFFAMRFIEGRGLDEVVKQSAAEGSGLVLPDIASRSRTAATIGVQIASALQYAHDTGVVHRDLKPSNILIDSEGAAWLTDFGLARLVESETEAALTGDGRLLGTLRYLPPEALDGPCDKPGDQYSLGLTLYEMVALRPAFDRTDTAGLIADLKEATPPRLDSLQPDAPADLVTIIHKAIDREPSTRYASAGKFAADLQRFLDDEPIHARPISSLERLVRWSRRNKKLAAALSTLAMLLLLVAVGSAVAAGYFSSLNNTLEMTVSDLTITSSELTSKTEALSQANDVVEQRAAENLRLAQESEAARQLSQTTLADMQTARGLRSLEANNYPEAMMWFATAAEQTPHDPQRQRNNRIRATSAMNNSPLPVAVFSCPERAKPERLEFQPGGPLLLSVLPDSFQVWEILNEQPLPWTIGLNDVFDVRWMPDGKHVVVGFESGRVEVRDVRSGQVTRTIQTMENCLSLACSPDSRFVAIGGNSVQVWELDGESRMLHNWPHPQPVHSLVFNGLGDRLASGCRDHMARVFVVASDGDDDGENENEIVEAFPHKPYRACAPVFVDGKRIIATVQDTNTMRWLDTESEDETVRSFSPGLHYRIVEPRASGPGLLAGIANRLEVWDAMERRADLGHPQTVVATAISRDQQTLLAGIHNWSTCVWDAPFGKKDPVTIPHISLPNACAISDSGLIAVCDQQQILIWKQAAGLTTQIAVTDWQTATYPLQQRPRPSFDGRLITMGNRHEDQNNVPVAKVGVINADTATLAGPMIPIEMSDSCICADNKTLAVVSGKIGAGRLSFHDIASGKFNCDVVDVAGVHSVAACPDKPLVAALCITGELLIVDSQNGTVTQSFKHEDWGFDSTLYDWATSDFNHVRAFWTPDGGALISLAPSGKVYVHEADGQLRFPPITLPIRSSGVCRAVDVSLDGESLATGITGENEVQVWSLKSGEPLCKPIPHAGDYWGLSAIKFSPDGAKILTGHRDRFARLWDWRTGKLVGPPMRHSEEVLDVAFTVDGRHCLTVTRAAEVQVWDPHAGKRMAATIQYPTDSNGIQKTVAAMAVVGDRVVVNDTQYPLIDLSQLLTESDQSSESLLKVAELATVARLNYGEAEVMTADEWLSTWKSLNERPSISNSGIELLARRFDRIADAATRWHYAQRAAQSPKSLQELARLRPDVPEILAVLATQLEERGQTQQAHSHRVRAIQLWEQHLVETASDIERTFLANKLTELLFAERLSIWKPLEIKTVISDADATFTTQPGGSVLVSGNHVAGDVYFIDGVCDLNHVAAVRLDVMPDDSLPNQGPGRHKETGNFNLAKIQMSAPDAGEETADNDLPFSDAWASYQMEAPGVDVIGTIRSDDTRVWHVWQRFGKPHHAVFQLQHSHLRQPDQTLSIQLHHRQGTPVNLGHFQLSVSAAPNAIGVEQLRRAIEKRLITGFPALAAIYALTGDHESTLKILDRFPESTSSEGIALLLRIRSHHSDGKPEQALQSYEKLMTWLQKETLSECFDTWILAAMLDVGRMDRPAAEAQLEQIKIRRQSTVSDAN